MADETTTTTTEIETTTTTTEAPEVTTTTTETTVAPTLDGEIPTESVDEDVAANDPILGDGMPTDVDEALSINVEAAKADAIANHAAANSSADTGQRS